MSQSNAPYAQITTVKLDGNNFLAWSQLATLSITSKGMWEYIIGEIHPPSPRNRTYLMWRAMNVIAMSWLLHSMRPDISSIYLFLATAKEI